LSDKYLENLEYHIDDSISLTKRYQSDLKAVDRTTERQLNSFFRSNNREYYGYINENGRKMVLIRFVSTDPNYFELDSSTPGILPLLHYDVKKNIISE